LSPVGCSIVGLTCGYVYGKQGKRNLIERLPRYNQAARFLPCLVIVDLDQDADCAPPFVQGILPAPSVGMQFRVAVRSIESWLLADAERLAAFLGIPVSKIPRNPDAEQNPKATLVNLARRSRRTAILKDMVPREGSGARVGPGYITRITEFVIEGESQWRPGVASQHSDSLSRCIRALRAFAGTPPS
jgi:hypothetical protein